MKTLRSTVAAIMFGFSAAAVSAVDLGEAKGLKVVAIRDPSGEPIALYRESHALVIAVSDYKAGWPRLPSVVREMENVVAALESNGFSVKRVLDPDSASLKDAFEQFITDYGYQKENRLLVFFSGHGHSRDDAAKGYLVPTDAPDPRKHETGFLRKALPMSQILAWCRQIEAKHVLFLFDSCFAGTIFQTKALPETPPHISAVISEPVRQFIAAGEADEEIPAKSVFADCFLRGLGGEADLNRDGYIVGTELGMYLHDKVVQYGSQTPHYGKIRDPDLDKGDFVFLVTTNAPPPSERRELGGAAVVDTTLLRGELPFWVTPRVGASSCTGIAGLEVQWDHLALSVGFIPDWPVVGAVKYVHIPARNSWYVVLAGGAREGNEDKRKGALVGLLAGYQWRWSSSWTLSLGLGGGYFSGDEDDSSDAAAMWDLSLGYSFGFTGR